MKPLTGLWQEHWPGYLIEAWGLGLFMVNASSQERICRRNLGAAAVGLNDNAVSAKNLTPVVAWGDMPVPDHPF